MQLAVSQLLGGHSATLILTACLVETSHSRLLLCRDILILLSFVVQEKMVQVGVAWGSMEGGGRVVGREG